MPCAHAMDLELHKRENPFNMLPLELRGRIIKDVFNLIIHEDEQDRLSFDQKKLNEHALRMPIFLGVRCIQEFYDLQKLKNKADKKQLSTHQIFTLPCSQRNAFIRMAEGRNWIMADIEGNVSIDDFKELMAIEDNDIKKGLVLKTSRGEAYRYILFFGLIGMGFGMPLFMFLTFPEYDQWNFVHKLVQKIVLCTWITAIPLLTAFVCFEDSYIYRDSCAYDNSGQLMRYDRFRSRGYEDRTLKYKKKEMI